MADFSPSSLGDLIPVVNKLQDLVLDTIVYDKLDLPQVVVVGSQSSGKSSVLENIVGEDFLPRGSGIVTRRPLILQLVNIPLEKGEDTKQWGEFLHLPDKRFDSFGEIRDEIARETARIAGSNKGIHRLPINLKIYSSKVLDLTLVDLPGLTKVPIGDQPTDIERQTKALILEYISRPNSLILAVSPANQDLVNSESLKLARQVDPAGKRTIGVLTKLDLMDKGTNAIEILKGTVYPLELGFVAVVNRSQQDIDESLSMKDSLENERAFFYEHAAYRGIAHKCGTAYLSKMLNHILMAHIRDRLPDIRARINTLISQTEQELRSYGREQKLGAGMEAQLILSLMTKFANRFVASIDGSSLDMSTKDLCGGARIYYIFNEHFKRQLDQIDPVGSLSYREVITAIRNSTGPRGSLFVPEQAFELLARPQIRILESPALRCVEMVYEELTKVCHSCGQQGLDRFPRLEARLIDTTAALLSERLEPTTHFVSELVEINAAYINTNNPKFLGAAEAIASVIQANSRPQQQLLTDAPGGVTGVEITSASTTTLDQQQQTESLPRGVIEDGGLNADASSVESGETPMRKDKFLDYFFGNLSQQGNGAQGSGFSNQQQNIAANGYGPTNASQSITSQFASPGGMGSVGGGPNGQSAGLFSSLDRISVSAAGQSGDGGYQTLGQPDIELTPRERLECDLIRKLIRVYFDIVRETIADQVPKAIMHLLVEFSKENAQTRLVTVLYKAELFSELLHEDESVVRERQKCQEMLDTYRRAAAVISEVL